MTTTTSLDAHLSTWHRGQQPSQQPQQRPPPRQQPPPPPTQRHQQRSSTAPSRPSSFVGRGGFRSPYPALESTPQRPRPLQPHPQQPPPPPRPWAAGGGGGGGGPYSSSSIDLPVHIPISLDGEEGYRRGAGGVARTNEWAWAEADASATSGRVVAPPNKTVWEGESPPPYRLAVDSQPKTAVAAAAAAAKSPPFFHHDLHDKKSNSALAQLSLFEKPQLPQRQPQKQSLQKHSRISSDSKGCDSQTFSETNYVTKVTHQSGMLPPHSPPYSPPLPLPCSSPSSSSSQYQQRHPDGSRASRQQHPLHHYHQHHLHCHCSSEVVIDSRQRKMAPSPTTTTTPSKKKGSGAGEAARGFLGGIMASLGAWRLNSSAKSAPAKNRPESAPCPHCCSSQSKMVFDEWESVGKHLNEKFYGFHCF